MKTALPLVLAIVAYGLLLADETNYSLSGTVTGSDVQMLLQSDEEEINATGSVSGDRIIGSFVSHSKMALYREAGRWSDGEYVGFPSMAAKILT